MKIILSRKGFDSVAGGCASPIFDDGSLFSLPILQPAPLPAPENQVRFSDIEFAYPIAKVVEDLTRRRVRAESVIHLDPDLNEQTLSRKSGWRPLFGQCNAAQTHLNQHSIGPGDIFLFFGWFREVEQNNGVFRYKRLAKDVHAFFGWLQVADVWRLGVNRVGIPEWASLHPHVTAEFMPSNTIYVTADQPNSAGAFRELNDSLLLTAPGANRSSWRLPKWFHPSDRKSCLSYHSTPTRWNIDNDYAYLQSVGRGQEFVLDTDDYPEAEVWVRRLITENSR